MRSIQLIPQCDVAHRDNEFEALSAEPWLTIQDQRLARLAGRFVEITYRASLWDDPVRPVFRFVLSDGTTIERIAAGPVAGAGIWIGRVPKGTVQCSVSPTHRLGPFRFEIESIRRRSWLGLLALGLLRNPRSTRSAILTRIIGWGPESDINLAWAIGSIKLAHYRAWYGKRTRPIDLTGFDAARADWAAGSSIHLWIDARGGTAGLDSTLQALDAQVFSRWTASVVSNDSLDLPTSQRTTQTGIITAPPSTAGLVGCLRPGDRLLPLALAYVAEAAHRHPACQLFYGDEEAETPAGLSPVFKPGWSRLLQRQQPFLGRAVFVTPCPDRSRGARTVRSRRRNPGCFDRSTVCANGYAATPIAATRAPPNHCCRSAGSDTVRRIGRDHHSTRDSLRDCAVPSKASDLGPARGCPILSSSTTAASKPRRKPCSLNSAKAGTSRSSTTPAPLNFSLMCNEGAAATNANVLVFLNDDTEALSQDWLDRLKYWASQPDYGAVGAN